MSDVEHLKQESNSGAVLDVSCKGAVPHSDSRDCTIFAINIENINNFMTTIGPQ